MRRDYYEFDAPGLDRPGSLLTYGHYGRPVLMFPAEAGRAWDLEDRGMIAAVAPLIDAGRIKVYAVDSFDHATWSDNWRSHEDRARGHEHYERWLLDRVLPTILNDSPGFDLGTGLVTAGVSMGAYHAVAFSLRHADVAPVAIGLSGNYDPTTWRVWGDAGDAAYFTNPMSFVPNLDGGHLDWLRGRVYPVLVVGQGAFEVSPTQSLPSTIRMGEVLGSKGIPHEVDVWGYDSMHDWPWWCRQIAHHLPRFC